MEQETLWQQYKLTIDARDKLNDNYYKWMSYYYLANAGVVLAITTLFTKMPKPDYSGILVLSLIGIFVCLLWHYSCKGYYYWSKSWIYLIIRLEKNLIKEDINLGCYSVFSEEVANGDDSILLPNKPANISTPKLTLLFSFCCIIFWYIYTGYIFLQYVFILSMCLKIWIMTIITIALVAFLIFILPQFAKSRYKKSHTLIQCLNDNN